MNNIKRNEILSKKLNYTLKYILLILREFYTVNLDYIHPPPSPRSTFSLLSTFTVLFVFQRNLSHCSCFSLCLLHSFPLPQCSLSFKCRSFAVIIFIWDGHLIVSWYLYFDQLCLSVMILICFKKGASLKRVNRRISI